MADGHQALLSETAFVRLRLFIFVFLCLSLTPVRAADPAIERGPWSGAVTSSNAVVKAKLAREGALARLLVSPFPDFRSPLYFGTARADGNVNNRVVAFRLLGLQPDTAYYYVLEVNGRRELSHVGRLRTFPAGPASFTFAYASCAQTASASPVFSTILQNQPLFYMCVGDFHYLNIKTNNRSLFRQAYDLVLSSPTQAELYRNVPFVYIWDDHDFGGDNSNRRASSHEAARKTYEEYVPHYPLAAGRLGDVPIYQAFTVGRARFILTDLRSERSPSHVPDNAFKSMMGAPQLAWFKHELLAARGRYPLIFWVSSVPWLGEAGVDYYPLPHPNFTGLLSSTEARSDPLWREDHWAVYATERRAIADFIKANQIKGVCILHGDAHSLCADNGSHADFATGGGARLPVMGAAPLDQTPSIKGGPYSQGVYVHQPGEGCFGLVTVTDEGERIEVTFSGRNQLNEEKIALKFSVPGR